MGIETEISWTDHTFNPWWGCTKVSPACDNCYAEVWAARTGYSDKAVSAAKFPIWGKNASRRFFGDDHWRQPLAWNRKAQTDGVIRNVFCGSMCDVMEDYNGAGFLTKETIEESRRWLYGLIDHTPDLNWLLLTKRPQNFRRFLPDSWLNNPRLNVWGMTTVESREHLWRIDALRETPFVIRGLSIEPLLADIGPIDLTDISWVIVGGESGPRARPFDIRWVRNTIRQCRDAGVPVFVKQMGSVPIVAACRQNHYEWGEGNFNYWQDERSGFWRILLRDKKGGEISEWPQDLRVREMPVAAR